MDVEEEGDYNYTYHYIVTTRVTPALRWAAIESHFNVLFIVRDKVTTQRLQTTTFEDKAC